jgi:aspartate/tyrosine/aromatic aminotransferase
LGEVRKTLGRALRDRGAQGDWSFLESQRRMFSIIPRKLLTEEHIRSLREEWHVYMLTSGQSSVPGLNERNLEHFTEAVAAVKSMVDEKDYISIQVMVFVNTRYALI